MDRALLSGRRSRGNPPEKKSHNMQITFENEESGIRVSYRLEDGYGSRRFAVLLSEKLSRSERAAESLGGCCISVRRESPDQTAVSPYCRIAVRGRRIDVTAGGILALDAAMRYFDRVLETGRPESCELRGDREAGGANAYAFGRHGSHRVMYYNILWDADARHCPGERNVMAADLVREFGPEVVGLQECGRYKRTGLYFEDIVSQMARVGYREAPVSGVKNSFHDVNCVPLFYRESEVRFVEGGYHWYVNQPTDTIGPMDVSSKSLSWGVFETRATGARFLAASTHLCTQVEGLRVAQAEEACRLFEELRRRYGLPMVLGGDFNSHHHDGGYRYFRDVAGYPAASGLATEYTATEKSYHAYPEFDPGLGLCMPTGGAEYETAKTIDHILFPAASAGLQVGVFGVVVNSFSLAASDHFPIFSDVTF